ncbi:MAG: hypothetical protein AB7V43_16290 [Acidimicrobiia bacterium]
MAKRLLVGSTHPVSIPGSIPVLLSRLLTVSLIGGLALSACSSVDDVRTVTDVELTRSTITPDTTAADDTAADDTGADDTGGSGATDVSPPTLVDLGKVIVTSADTVHGGPWVLQPFEVGDTGPTDLAKAISDDGGSDAEQFLTDAEFVDGYQQLFIANAEDQLVVQLFRFATADGATSYLQRWSSSLASTGQPFGVINLPDAVAVGIEDTTTQSAIVLASYDTTFIAVQTNVAAGVISNQEVAGIAADVARQQVAKLIVTTR